MFEQFKALGQVAALLKDKDRLRQIAAEFRERVDRITVEAEAGGGAVRVTVSGRMQVLDVRMDPAVIAALAGAPGAAVQVQSLIREATNDALARAQALVREAAERQAAELGLPGLGGLGGLLP